MRLMLPVSNDTLLRIDAASNPRAVPERVAVRHQQECGHRADLDVET
jgi:hypothetical protein